MNARPGQFAANLPGTASKRSALVCFAVNQEAAPFRRLAAGRAHVRVVVTGIGRRNAERCIKAELSRFAPEFVLTAGFAGGLRAGLPAGTVLYEADPEPWLQESLAAAGAVPGKFHFADRVAITAAEKRSLWEKTGADAVEMESQVICQYCREVPIPSATVRVILDVVEEDLPLDFNALMTKDERLNGWKLAGMLLKQPERIAALRGFQRRCRSVAARLAEVLGKAV